MLELSLVEEDVHHQASVSKVHGPDVFLAAHDEAGDSDLVGFLHTPVKQGIALLGVRFRHQVISAVQKNGFQRRRFHKGDHLNIARGIAFCLREILRLHHYVFIFLILVALLQLRAFSIFITGRAVRDLVYATETVGAQEVETQPLAAPRNLESNRDRNEAKSERARP